MTIPIDRLAALCPLPLRDGLELLSPRQVSTIRRRITQAIHAAKRRNPWSTGHRASQHPRAKYWREWKRRKYHDRKAQEKRAC